MAIALYPGAYKPPHRGHFEVVNSLLNGTFTGALYSLEDYKDKADQLLKEDREKPQPIDKVIITIGGGTRDGIDQQMSKAIWEIYAKHLPQDRVEILADEPNPLRAANEIAKANPDQQYYAITGIRSEDDITDLKRVSMFKNRENVQGLVITPASGESTIRATDFRKNLLSGNLDTVADFFPKQLTRREMITIVNMLKDAIISENMKNAVNQTLDNMFEDKEDVDERHQWARKYAPKQYERYMNMTEQDRASAKPFDFDGFVQTFKDLGALPNDWQPPYEW